MKKILMFLFLFSVSAAWAAVPSPQTPMILLPDGTYWDGNIDATLDTGNSTIGTVGAIISPLPTGTNDIGKTKQSPYTNASYTNVTLTPGAAYSIPLMTGMKSISIANESSSGEFWVGLKTATVAISTGKRVLSSITIENIDLTPISIIASTALPISIMQLGY